MSLFSVTGDWTQGLTNVKHMCYNCPDRRAARATCAIQLIETMGQKKKKNENFLWESHAGGGESLEYFWCHPEEECMSQDEISLSSDHLSGLFKGQVITNRTTSWPGRLNYACLFPSILNPSLMQYPKDGLGESLVPFICSSSQCHSQ